MICMSEDKNILQKIKEEKASLRKLNNCPYVGIYKEQSRILMLQTTLAV